MTPRKEASAPVFIDTSAFYAVLDRDDSYHARARRIWASLLDSGAALVTTNYIAVETCAQPFQKMGFVGSEVDGCDSDAGEAEFDAPLPDVFDERRGVHEASIMKACSPDPTRTGIRRKFAASTRLRSIGCPRRPGHASP